MEHIDIESLPKELVDQLAKEPSPVGSGMCQAVLGALGSEPTSINMILIRMYQNTGKVFKRTSVMSECARLRKLGVTERVSPGVYKLVDSGNMTAYTGNV